MPIEIKAYKCKFKCGYVAIGKKWTIKHEVNCNRNPDKYGCVTCRNFLKSLDSSEMPECEQDYMGTITSTNTCGLRYNCPKWENKQTNKLPKAT